MAQQFIQLTLDITAAAERDLYDIWDYNAETYSPGHADDYIAFIDRETRQLESNPTQGQPILSRSKIRMLMIRQGGGAGYYAVYRIKGETIEVARYLHTARDLHGMATRGEI